MTLKVLVDPEQNVWTRDLRRGNYSSPKIYQSEDGRHACIILTGKPQGDVKRQMRG